MCAFAQGVFCGNALLSTCLNLLITAVNLIVWLSWNDTQYSGGPGNTFMGALNVQVAVFLMSTFVMFSVEHAIQANVLSQMKAQRSDDKGKLVSRLLRTTCDASVETDASLRIGRPAQDLARLLLRERSTDQLLGRKLTDFMTNEDAQRLSDYVAKTVACQTNDQLLYPLNFELINYAESLIRVQISCSYLKNSDHDDCFLFGFTVLSEHDVAEPSQPFARCDLAASGGNDEGRVESQSGRSSGSSLAESLVHCVYDVDFKIQEISPGFTRLMAQKNMVDENLLSLFQSPKDADEFSQLHQIAFNKLANGVLLPGHSLMWGPAVLKLKGRVGRSHRYVLASWHIEFFCEDECWTKLVDVQRYRFAGRGTYPQPGGTLIPASHSLRQRKDSSKGGSTSSKSSKQESRCMQEDCVLGRTSI